MRDSLPITRNNWLKASPLKGEIKIRLFITPILFLQQSTVNSQQSTVNSQQSTELQITNLYLT
ncbi:MAG: hypothetical protein ACMG55_01480 [Microcoleus sp.]